GALYSWSYDQYLAIGCAVVALAIARGQRAFTIAALALFIPVSLVLWLSAFARYHDTGSGLMPVLAIGLLAAAAWSASRQSAGVAAGTS
ncbi:MAG TPA: hypothetical protein VJQ09_04295, partial [Candidatus Limnocylindria bacterium]|nr:hypothetical protein [Candidatus Limnocylindria bacterium]